MRDFFAKNGKVILRLYINQIIMSIFSIVVLIAVSADNVLLLLASFLALGLYLFLTYNLMWETGAKIAARKLGVKTTPELRKRHIATALKIVLIGEFFNFICATGYFVIKIYISAKDITEGAIAFAGNVIWIVVRLFHAVYMGFEALLFPSPLIGLTVEEALNISVEPMMTSPYFFFLTPLPVIIIGVLAYVLGASEISILQKFGFDIKYKMNKDINYKNDKR